jgi:hypothetical protein
MGSRTVRDPVSPTAPASPPDPAGIPVDCNLCGGPAGVMTPKTLRDAKARYEYDFGTPLPPSGVVCMSCYTIVRDVLSPRRN